MIGWTVESDKLPISFDSIPEKKVLFIKITGDDYPKVGETHTANKVGFPSVFSIAVLLAKGVYNFLLRVFFTSNNGFKSKLIEGLHKRSA